MEVRELHEWAPGNSEQRLNIAESALHPPMEPRERSLRDASVHIRAPLSSISQENENNKTLYSALPTQEILPARMLTGILRRKKLPQTNLQNPTLSQLAKTCS